jgi:DNA-binding GntR family transcriptional regulator
MPQLKYEQIAEDLRTRIANGEFGPGELLPSGRDLAEQWGVSRATVVKAYDVLRNDGLVSAKQGAGFVVVETPVARPAGARRAGSSRVTGARIGASVFQTVRCRHRTSRKRSGWARVRKCCGERGSCCSTMAPRTPW